MLRRIGLTKKTEFLTMATVYFTSCLIMVMPFTLTIKILVLPSADTPLLLVFYVLYVTHHFLLRISLDFF